MAIVHIVMFQFKPEFGQDIIQEVRFSANLDLKSNVLTPKSIAM